jgi:hypothetical protein
MYAVGFIQIDRADWETALKTAIAEALRGQVNDSATVTIVDIANDVDLVLCLGSPELARDANADQQCRELLQRGVRVLPIVGKLDRFKLETPTALDAINGMEWNGPSEIAEEVLRHLGLTERDRRVFLSYLRRETTPLAHQLYDELHRRGFFVFLDSFEIEHGERVQDRIEQALHETAFVLLLYSPSVEASGWVEKEINFALTHRLGMMALALPGAANRMPFRMTPGDRRIQLEAGDLDASGKLTKAALEKTCLDIEQEHAVQFRGRRERLLQDISEALGKNVVRVGMHSILFESSSVTALIRVTPRSPQTRDLYLLDQDCRATAGSEKKLKKRVLVAIKGGYREYRELTQWACTALQHKVEWLEPQEVCADPSVLEQAS